MDPFPQHGNPATHNIETVLERNIVASECEWKEGESKGDKQKGAHFFQSFFFSHFFLSGMYYKNKCLPLTTVPDLVDEIYYSVTDVEPWLSGAARGTPSTAFCLLHRFCSLRPTLREVRSLLDHADSPYIRAIGFLFLRYVGDPRTVWGLVDPYLADPEEFCPSPTQTAPGERAPGGDQNTQTVTLGAFVRDLFLSHVYYETLAPRIPKPVSDGWVAALRARGLPCAAAGNGGLGGRDRRGGGGDGRPQSVKAALAVSMGGGGGRHRHRSPPPERRRDAEAQRPRGWGGGGGGGGGKGRDRRRSRSRSRLRSPPQRRRSRSRSPPRRRDFDDRDYSRRHGELYTRARGWTPPREHHHRR